MRGFMPSSFKCVPKSVQTFKIAAKCKGKIAQPGRRVYSRGRVAVPGPCFGYASRIRPKPQVCPSPRKFYALRRRSSRRTPPPQAGGLLLHGTVRAPYASLCSLVRSQGTPICELNSEPLSASQGPARPFLVPPPRISYHPGTHAPIDDRSASNRSCRGKLLVSLSSFASSAQGDRGN